MTDRELLELAARAAGLRTRSDKSSIWIVEEDGSPIRRWNPLADGNDALNLAVKLAHDGIYVIDIGVIISSAKRNGADPYASARRAIVRAAAEIGKAMP